MSFVTQKMLKCYKVKFMEKYGMLIYDNCKNIYNNKYKVSIQSK